MNTWLYNNKPITSLNDLPETCVGFVYIITNIKNGKIYVGKKTLKNKNNVKLGVKERKAIPAARGRKPTKKLVIKESNWADYWGSSEKLSHDISLYGKDIFKREIIHLCFNKKQMSYYEIKYQFLYKVIEEPEKSYNLSILGKFFNSDLK